MLRQVVSNACIKSFWDGYHLASALSSVKSRLPPLDDESPVLLAVEGTLVLQPPPVSSNATNLLAVVIRWWVGQRGRGRIDAVALDAVEEGGIFLDRR